MIRPRQDPLSLGTLLSCTEKSGESGGTSTSHSCGSAKRPFTPPHGCIKLNWTDHWVTSGHHSGHSGSRYSSQPIRPPKPCLMSIRSSHLSSGRRSKKLSPEAFSCQKLPMLVGLWTSVSVNLVEQMELSIVKGANVPFGEGVPVRRRSAMVVEVDWLVDSGMIQSVLVGVIQTM
jgi:hypothetical protein